MPVLLNEIEKLLNQMETDWHVTDQLYVDKLIEKIQLQWGTVRSFQGLEMLNRAIIDLLVVLPIDTIPLYNTSTRKQLVMWLYNHSGEFWIPTNNGDVFKHLNRIFIAGVPPAFLREDFDVNVYLSLLRKDVPLKQPFSPNESLRQTTATERITDQIIYSLNMGQA